MKPAALICIIAALASATPIAAATGGPAYDGAWSLHFVTQRGLAIRLKDLTSIYPMRL
jgi:hypothetical protein